MSESASRRPLGFLCEVHAREVEVLLGHPEVRMTSSLHHRPTAVTGVAPSLSSALRSQPRTSSYSHPLFTTLFEPIRLDTDHRASLSG